MQYSISKLLFNIGNATISMYSPEYIVLELVVAGQGDHPSPSNSQGKEDLDAGISPDLVQVYYSMTG